MNGGAHLRTALLMTGPQGHGGADDPDDAAVRQKLGALGYKVERRSCGHEEAAREAVEEAKPRRLSLAILTPTAPASAGRAFLNVSIPLVAMNPALYAELGLTGKGAGRDFGALSSEGHSLRIDLCHPMAAELPASPDVSKPPFDLGWGLPFRTAHVVEVKEPGAAADDAEWVESFMAAASEKFDPRSPFRASRTPSLGSLLYVI